MESPNPPPVSGYGVKDGGQADLGGETRAKFESLEGCRASFRRACAGLDGLSHVVGSKEMSCCDKFHCSLDESRRSAPSDQVGQSDSFHDLLRHLDLIMLNIEEQCEAEHNNTSDGAAQVVGTLSLCPTHNFPFSNSNSSPDITTVDVNGPRNQELCLFYEKQRFMDYTSRLIPEEINEMYDHGRLPELGYTGGCINQFGYIDEIVGEERFRDGAGGEFCPGTGNGHGPEVSVEEAPSSDQDCMLGTLEADGVLAEQIGVDANTANFSTDTVEAKVEGVPVTLPKCTEEAGDGSRSSQAAPPKADNSYPGMDHVADGQSREDKRGSRQCLESRRSEQKQESQKRGVTKRKCNSRMPSLERGLLEAHRNISGQGIKEEVASDHQDSSPQSGSKKRRCRVGDLSEDIKCEGILRVPCKLSSGASRVEVLTQVPMPTLKEMGGRSCGKQLQKSTGLRTAREKSNVAVSAGGMIAVSCELKKNQGMNRDTKCTRCSKAEHNPSRSQLSTKQVSDSSDCSLTKSAVPPASGKKGDTRVWRPKIWSQDKRYNSRKASEDPSTITDFRASYNQRLEPVTKCSSKQDKGGPSDQHLQANIAVKLEGERRCFRDSHEGSKGIGCGDVDGDPWRGLCSQGSKNAPSVRSKELAAVQEVLSPGISSRPSFSRYAEGGLDRAMAPILFPGTHQSSCYQVSSSFSHKKSIKGSENVAATSLHPVIPPDESTTDQFISSPSSKVLGNRRDRAKLIDTMQSHDSSQCPMAQKICGSDVGASKGSFEKQILQWTSSQVSFEQAQYAIDHGLQSEHDFNGIRVIRLLMSCVEALNSGEEGVGFAEALLARLTDMVDIAGYPLQRVAAHFTTGLKSAFGIGMNNSYEATLAEAHLVGAYEVIHEVLPYIKFVHFTANQALLEAFHGKQEMHILDYDIMDGMQWPPLMYALAKARDGHQENSANNSVMTTPTKLRITAISRGKLPGNTIASSVSETGRRLEAFAKSLDLQFEFRAVQEPDIQLEEVQELWRALFRDLVDEQKSSPALNGKEILGACAGVGCNEVESKPDMNQSTKESLGHRVLTGKSVPADRVTKTWRFFPGRDCTEWTIRAQPDQLENDSASDMVHDAISSKSRADQESPLKPVEQRQVQVNQKRTSPAQQFRKRKGKATDRGRGIAPKSKGANLGDDDEKTVKMHPLKPEVRTHVQLWSQDVCLLKVELEEQHKPSRRDKVASKVSKRKTRLETLAVPSLRTASDVRLVEGMPTSAPRFTVWTQLTANNAQGAEDDDINCSENLVNQGGDNVAGNQNAGRRNDAATEVTDGRAQQGTIEHGIGWTATEKCGHNIVQKSKTVNQVLKHADEEQKIPEFAMNAKLNTENKLHLDGQEEVTGVKLINEWDGVVSGRRDNAFKRCVRDFRRFRDGHEAGNDRAPESSKVQRYYRRRRPSDRNRIIPSPDLSRGGRINAMEKLSYGGTGKGIQQLQTKSDNLAPVVNQNNEPDEQKLNSSRSVGNEESSRGNKTTLVSSEIEKHSMNGNADKCLAVNCMLHLPHMAHQETGSINSFLAAAGRFSPRILTVGEDGMSMPGTEDFVTYFCEGLYHFCAFSDSLEESLPGKELASAVVEQLFCAPRIKSMLQGARDHMKREKSEHQERGLDTRTSPRRLGFHSLPFTSLNRYQGKLLLQNFPIGYEVLERDRSDSDHTLLLAWKGQPIVAVSAWR